MEFKADFHCVSMRARKDPEQKWYDLPYLALDLIPGSSKSVANHKKEDARIKMERFVEKRKKEDEDKAKAEHAAKKSIKGQEEEEERDSDRSQKSPSPKT